MIDLFDFPGKKITVIHPGDKFTSSNCLGCEHLKDTGYSWICTATNEKLEGYNSMEEKMNNINTHFLHKHMGIGVGFKCPCTQVIKSKMTKIKLLVSLEYLKDFIDNRTFDLWTEIDEEKNRLIVTANWYDDGYESNKDYVLDRLFSIQQDIENRFLVKTEEIDDDDCYIINITVGGC